MKPPELGRTVDGQALSIDVDRLVVTRMLLQANSGAGKSWAMRRLLEQTHGRVQQLVIDVEDEYYTLRERFDYVLAGRDGDCPAEPRSAAMLARKLLELGTSAVLSIYELKAHERIQFVKLFLEALVDAPKKLWHPALVVLDEAHIFCPEKGKAESAAAVIDLMTRGRKRGFCGILATQRLAKLNKDAAAEANNKLIGRSALDVDMDRAAAELGFRSRDQQLQLRTLPDGNFFAFGPALSVEVLQVHVGAVTTSHHRAGEASAPAPPAREKVQKVLAQLADLPRQAEEEIRTLAAAQTRIAQLERELRAKPKPVAPPAAAPLPKPVVKVVEIPALELQALELLAKASSQLNALGDRIARPLGDAQAALLAIIRDVKAIAPKLAEAKAAVASPGHPYRNSTSSVVEKLKAPPAAVVARAEVSWNANVAGGKSALDRILRALASYPEGMSDRKLAILAGIKRGGSTWRGALALGRYEGWIVRGAFKLTDAGMEHTAGVAPLPEGSELRKHWQRELGVDSAAGRIFELLVKAFPNALEPDEISTATGIVAGGSTWRGALAKLRGLDLVPRGELRACTELFEER